MSEQKKNKRKYSRLHEICDKHGIDVVARYGSKLNFPTYTTKQFSETDIEVLDLDVRSYNCLKRYGIHTLGDLISRIHSTSDLRRIRNCGSNSSSKILDALFAYQYEILDEKGKNKFVEDLIRMNS